MRYKLLELSNLEDVLDYIKSHHENKENSISASNGL